MKKRVRNLIRKLILKAKKVSFVGFGGIPIYDVGYFFYNAGGGCGTAIGGLGFCGGCGGGCGEGGGC